ncbi:restriction endonuclease subunit S [Acidithiobacillus ferrivorans]|uniref:restriction endonuclease subunit S n=1 Tax=Acidithiobacillus ferrivorans TaxID=160808 RepID=UPI0018E58B58|nr:restriction endonuclease subunit S [Acidithiobacillus ferrivorans]
MNSHHVGPIKDFALGIYDGPHATPKEADEGPIFLGIKNVTPQGTLDFSEIRHVSDREYPRWTKRVVPRENDIVFSYKATLHRYALIPEGFRGCLGRRMALVRPDPTKVYPRFLHYYFLTPSWRTVVEANIISGATVDRVPLAKFPDFEVRLPVLDVQRRIASILSAYDDLIENNRRRIQLLEQAARLLYKEWFVHLRFPGHEHVKVKDGVPDGWEKKKIADICETVGGGTPSTKSSEYWYGDITWVVPSDITKNDCLALFDSERKITEKGLRESSAKMVPTETILMTSRASVGFFALMEYEVCTNQGFINIIPHVDEMRMYLLFNLMSRVEEIRSNAKGTTYPEISKGRFRDMAVVIPTAMLVNEFSGFASDIINQVRILKKSTLKLERSRDLLLPRLMNGEVAV